MIHNDTNPTENPTADAATWERYTALLQERVHLARTALREAESDLASALAKGMAADD